MAINCNTIGKSATQGTAALPTAAMTFTIRFVPSWDPGDGAVHVLFSQSNGAGLFFDVVKYSDNKLYAGWFSGGTDHRAVADAGATGIVQGESNLIVVTCDDAANVTDLWVNGTKVATKGTLVTGNLAGVMRRIGDSPDLIGFNPAAAFDLFGIYDAKLTDDEIALLQWTAPSLVRAAALTDFVRFGAHDISGATVTARTGTNATLVGAPDVVAGAPICEYRLTDIKAATEAKLADSAANSEDWPAGLSPIPQGDWWSIEGGYDMPGLYHRTGEEASTGVWVQSAADGRAATSILDGESTFNELFAIAAANHTAHTGNALPEWTGGPNDPQNFRRDAYQYVFSSASTYVEFLVIRAASLSGTVGNWNRGMWPGAPDSPVICGPNGRVSISGKYSASVQALSDVLIVGLYHGPFGWMYADDTGGGAPQWNTLANWKLDHPECIVPGDDEQTRWKLAGPAGEQLCTDLAAAYPGKGFVPSYETSVYAHTDPSRARIEAEITAATQRRIEAAGGVGAYHFDVGVVAANSEGDSVRRWWAEYAEFYQEGAAPVNALTLTVKLGYASGGFSNSQSTITTTWSEGVAPSETAQVLVGNPFGLEIGVIDGANGTDTAVGVSIGHSGVRAAGTYLIQEGYVYDAATETTPNEEISSGVTFVYDAGPDLTFTNGSVANNGSILAGEIRYRSVTPAVSGKVRIVSLGTIVDNSALQTACFKTDRSPMGSSVNGAAVEFDGVAGTRYIFGFRNTGGVTRTCNATISLPVSVPTVVVANTSVALARNVVDDASVTHFKISGITGGKVYKHDGVTEITEGAYITHAEGVEGLVSKASKFHVQASRGDDGTQVSEVVIAETRRPSFPVAIFAGSGGRRRR